jgi:hypothetical protein
MRRIILLATAALLMTAMLAVLGAGTAVAHPHVALNAEHTQPIANSQNHPVFFIDPVTGLLTSCEGMNELPNTGPAFYGLETAHHGPDAGDPGKDEGCYAAEGTLPLPPPSNEAIG